MGIGASVALLALGAVLAWGNSNPLPPAGSTLTLTGDRERMCSGKSMRTWA
jgi:hypothetical protein